MGSSIVDIENPEDLLRYLRGTRRIGQKETPAFRTLRGGVSNKTVLLQREDGSRWVLKQALPKLRVKADWFSDPARIHVEALALRYLPRVAPPNSTPELLFENAPQHLYPKKICTSMFSNLEAQNFLLDCYYIYLFFRPI